MLSYRALLTERSLAVPRKQVSIEIQLGSKQQLVEPFGVPEPSEKEKWVGLLFDSVLPIHYIVKIPF